VKPALQRLVRWSKKVFVLEAFLDGTNQRLCRYPINRRM
jgi:hypothetical protein